MNKINQEDLQKAESSLRKLEEQHGRNSEEYKTNKQEFDRLLRKYSSQFTTGQAFPPANSNGKEFEISLGICTIDGVTGSVYCRVRIDGKTWVDLDTGQPLASQFKKHVVHAFRDL